MKAFLKGIYSYQGFVVVFFNLKILGGKGEGVL